jgi:exopolyphosphatase/guanosine-5'-triphosphate,3'-diphosphate pyrophosphatase
MNQQKQYISVLDIGSNSFHFILAQIKNNAISIIERERYVLRLSKFDIGGVNIISIENFNNALEIIKKIDLTSKSYNSKLIIVATSAVRESENKEKFIEYIYSQTGHKINLLSGENEAELIFSGVLNSLNDISNKFICNIDIGGGSTEIILGNNEKIQNSVSLKIGAVRMSQQFFENYELTEQAITNCYEYLMTLLKANLSLNDFSFVEKFVGTSGTILTILELLKKNSIIAQKKNSFSYNHFVIIKDRILNAKTIEHRLAIPGVEVRRADILPAGVIIIDSIFKFLQIKELRVSSYSLREGVVFAILNKSNKIFI